MFGLQEHVFGKVRKIYPSGASVIGGQRHASGSPK